VNVHAKSLLALELSADTPARNQGPGLSLPGPEAGHPLQGAGQLAIGQLAPKQLAEGRGWAWSLAQASGH
jgi:hypothetical protein